MRLSLAQPDLRAIKRFLKYVLVGGSTFLFDLLLLSIFIDIFRWNPVFATASGFIIAVSCNYLLSRRFVFKGTLRSIHAGYGGFMLIAGSGLLIITSGMYLLVTVLGWHYLLARILVSLPTGIWNYLLNLFVNFRVAGKYS